jgi:hypothetical protein
MEEASAFDVHKFLEDGRRAEENAASEVVVEDGWLEDAGNFFMYPLRFLMGEKKNEPPEKDLAEKELSSFQKIFRFGSSKPQVITREGRGGWVVGGGAKVEEINTRWPVLIHEFNTIGTR